MYIDDYLSAVKIVVVFWQGRRPGDLDYVSNDALRSMCDNVLLLLSTTVDNMQCVRMSRFTYFVLARIDEADTEEHRCGLSASSFAT